MSSPRSLISVISSGSFRSATPMLRAAGHSTAVYPCWLLRPVLATLLNAHRILSLSVSNRKMIKDAVSTGDSRPLKSPDTCYVFYGRAILTQRQRLWKEMTFRNRSYTYDFPNSYCRFTGSVSRRNEAVGNIEIVWETIESVV